MQKRINVLFVCSKNKWRSRTAETIYRNDTGLNVRSAGTEKDAQVKVDESLINWAEVIFVMEKKHKEFLRRTFPHSETKNIITLDIPDEYKYMDNELIETLQSCVNDFFRMNKGHTNNQ